MADLGGASNFEGGRIVISTGDVQVLTVDLSSTHIDVNIEDKAFIKRVIAMRSELSANLPATGADDGSENPPQIGGALAAARSVAETLCSRGITITIAYKGHRIATIGAEANPKLLHRITKTRGIAINSVFAAIKMVI